MSLIEATHLSKYFTVKTSEGSGLTGVFNALLKSQKKIVKAVDDISFAVQEGELIGFIGPNGAGKSTTIKMLTGILTPSEGKVEVCGFEPYKNRMENAQNIGAVFGQRTQLWWDLPVIESYKLLKKIYKISDDTYKKNLEFFTRILEMEPFIRQPVRQLSLGQRMRCDIAAAFLHNPSIVYLDEPTIGLDVPAKHRMREFISEINEKKKATILLTTHDMQEIEDLCKRVVIVNHGKIIYEGTVENMRRCYNAKNVISFQLNDYLNPNDLTLWSSQIEIEVNEQILTVKTPENIPAGEIISYISQRYNVLDISISKTSIDDIIEEVFMQ